MEEFTEQLVDGFFEVKWCVLKKNLKPGKRALDSISSVMSDIKITDKCFSPWAYVSSHSEIIGMIWFKRNSWGNHLQRLKCIKKIVLPRLMAELTPTSRQPWVMADQSPVPLQKLPSGPGSFLSQSNPPSTMGYRGLAPCLHSGQLWRFSSRVPEFRTGLVAVSFLNLSHTEPNCLGLLPRTQTSIPVCFSGNPISEPRFYRE